MSNFHSWPRTHGDLMAQLDVTTRAAAGGVFRRILMAEEFVLRYLVDVPREQAEQWADYLADRYTKPLDGHLESLRDRVTAYLETLARAGQNESLLAGYHAAAENLNVVQLVKGDTANRDHFFLGFNTPYRPEVLISTSVGQEGIDLHRECRHIIHHDLCWNPATIEQRTGRVDRIGSKVERERPAPKTAEGRPWRSPCPTWPPHTMSGCSRNCTAAPVVRGDAGRRPARGWTDRDGRRLRGARPPQAGRNRYGRRGSRRGDGNRNGGSSAGHG